MGEGVWRQGSAATRRGHRWVIGLTLVDWIVDWSFLFAEEMTMSIEIGSYEAKTRLPELLRGIREGSRYTITLRGQPIAELVPVATDAQVIASDAADEMRAFMLAREGRDDIDLKALIEEGRA